ncbi:MAG: hypothetical protein IJT66_03755 [Clostridia bacterium]|nr:hypothetical protein [Clostridia bacterium]
MTEEQAKRLAEPFPFNEIEWRVLRVSKKKPVAQVAAYVDSRAIQNRLDKVLGRENWQNRFVTVAGNGEQPTAHICEISIYYPDRGEWITKSDGAGCTDIEPVKGGLSNAFKRAASMWNLGRYLYGLKDIWAEIDEYKTICKEEYPELERKYNAFLKKLQGEAPPKKEGLSKGTSKPAEEEKGSIPPGRFSAEKTQKPLPKGGCRITAMKVVKGAKSTQTLLTLENAKGKTLSGFVRGEPDLQTGQILFNPKIVTKNSPAVGEYHIIESYDLAA